MKIDSVVPGLRLAVVLFMSLFFGTPLFATVCIDCHRTKTGRALEALNAFEKGIHQKYDISCHSCHGGDSKDWKDAMNPLKGFLGVPKRRDIPKFCGRCHIGVAENFNQSVHGKDLASGPVCIDCHFAHATQKAAIDLINEKNCSKCHSYEGSKILKAAFQETEEFVEALQGKNSSLKMEGFDVESKESRLFASRNELHSILHEVDLPKVKEVIAKIKPGLDKISAEQIVIGQEKSKRKVIGTIAILIMVLLAGLLHFLRRSLDDGEGKPK